MSRHCERLAAEERDRAVLCRRSRLLHRSVCRHWASGRWRSLTVEMAGAGRARTPRVWALRLALGILVAAVLTILAALHTRSGTATDQGPGLQRFCEHSGARAVQAPHSRPWRPEDRCWYHPEDRLVRAFPCRRAVAWSLAAGAISWVESHRMLSPSRSWMAIAALAGEQIFPASASRLPARVPRCRPAPPSLFPRWF